MPKIGSEVPRLACAYSAGAVPPREAVTVSDPASTSEVRASPPFCALRVDLTASPPAIQIWAFCAGGCRDSGSRGQAFRPNRHDGLIFVWSDPDNAPLKAGLGVLLDIGVRRVRVDSRQDGVHRHRRVPFLDVRQQHAARRIAWVEFCLRRCPIVYRRRKLGLADELLLRWRQVDEDEVGGGKCIAMTGIPTSSLAS
jgi:hypothetical protein